jgi:hypothetical protein
VVNHECVCGGTVCGGNCSFGEGVCCNNKWNVGASDCNFDFDEILGIVNESNDSEAVESMGKAVGSVQNGNIVQGKAEAKVAEMKAKIVLAGNPPELEEAYENMKLALTNKDYGQVDELAIVVQEKLDDREKNSFNLNNPQIQLAILLSAIAIIAILILLATLKPKAKNSQT